MTGQVAVAVAVKVHDHDQVHDQVNDERSQLRELRQQDVMYRQPCPYTISGSPELPGFVYGHGHGHAYDEKQLLLYRGRDSNPHALRRAILSRLRLPFRHPGAGAGAS
jgi:hypothetical protein